MKKQLALTNVAVAQLNIRRTLMIKTNPLKCKILIIRSKNHLIPIFKSLTPMKMSCATSTNAPANADIHVR
jgi:microcystin degradation protein MlrC